MRGGSLTVYDVAHKNVLVEAWVKYDVLGKYLLSFLDLGSDAGSLMVTMTMQRIEKSVGAKRNKG